MCYEECSMLQRISWHFLQQVHVFNRLAAVGGDDMPAHGLFSFSVLSRIWLQEAGSGPLGSYNLHGHTAVALMTCILSALFALDGRLDLQICNDGTMTYGLCRSRLVVISDR